MLVNLEYNSNMFWLRYYKSDKYIYPLYNRETSFANIAIIFCGEISAAKVREKKGNE